MAFQRCFGNTNHIRLTRHSLKRTICSPDMFDWNSVAIEHIDTLKGKCQNYQTNTIIWAVWRHLKPWVWLQTDPNYHRLGKYWQCSHQDHLRETLDCSSWKSPDKGIFLSELMFYNVENKQPWQWVWQELLIHLKVHNWLMAWDGLKCSLPRWCVKCLLVKQINK